MTNSEKALQMHEQWNGKDLKQQQNRNVNSREDLAIAYTPGVAEPCKVIAQNPEAAYKYTMKANTVAVVSDGSAVLGLGNIGALAAMPVMEGKAVLFKEFGGVNAVRSVWIHRTQKRSLNLQSTSHRLSVESIQKIFQLHAVSKLKHA